MNEITWDKGRVGVFTSPSGDEIPVWLSDDGTDWRYAMNGLARSVDDDDRKGTITPLEDWTPPRQDGVWMCKGRSSGIYAAFCVVGGRVRGGSGADISDYWKPVKRMCPIPDEWEFES